jgi:two-component system phosphate regulon response regulator OmpR
MRFTSTGGTTVGTRTPGGTRDGGTGRSILVVEDDAAVAELIARALAGLGAVTVAADAGGAMAALGRVRPDAVLLDVNLPGEDGFSLLARVRALSDVPVLMVTGRAAPEDRRTGWELGADQYVTKPFSPRELRARVRMVLRRRG